MKTKTIKLLTFNELSETQKEKVLNNYRYINTEDLDFNDWDLKIIEEDIKPYFKFEKVSYSLSYSQGDGARIEVSGILKKAISLIYKSSSPQYKTLMYLFNNDLISFDYCLNLFDNHYCHYNTFSLIGHYYGDNDKHESLVEEFEGQLEDYLKDKSKEVTKDLYSILESLESDDSVKDTLECNEYLFNEETLKIDEVQ